MAAELQLVVVTPETTLLDEKVTSVRFPLFDGQLGVLPGRFPLVGRLGVGELRLVSGIGERSYFVDGGFVQVRGLSVTVLTPRCLLADEIQVDLVAKDLEESLGRPASTDEAIDTRMRDQERARRLLSLAKK